MLASFLNTVAVQKPTPARYISCCLLSVLPMLCDLSVQATDKATAQTSAATARITSPVEIQQAVHQVRQSLIRSATITVGFDDAEDALKMGDPGIPIIALFISSTEFSMLLEEYRNTTPITAIFGNPDPLAQTALAQELFPKGVNAIIKTPQNALFVNQIASDSTKLIQADDDVTQLTQQLSGIDVLIALPDRDGVNRHNIQHIISAMFQQRSVVIGYSRKMVAIGCLASIFPQPASVVDALRIVVEDFNRTSELPEPMFVRDYAIAVNRRLARSLDIVIPNRQRLLRNINARTLTHPPAPQGHEGDK